MRSELDLSADCAEAIISCMMGAGSRVPYVQYLVSMAVVQAIQSQAHQRLVRAQTTHLACSCLLTAKQAGHSVLDSSFSRLACNLHKCQRWNGQA